MRTLPQMRIIMCDNGFDPKEVDEMYAEEYRTAKELGLSVSLMSFEELKRGDAEFATRRIRPNAELSEGLYRGWMLTPKDYAVLYDILLQKNIRLINNLEEYTHCHYLPSSYNLIADHTPKTTFKPLVGPFQYNDFKAEIEAFKGGPIIVKDYVKSQKHHWEEACFIPDSADQAKTCAVVEKFIELQGESLNEGLVFREFVALEELTSHSASGMPLTKEFRLVIKNGKVIAAFEYWDEGDYQGVEPVVERFTKIISTIKSNFFTMDIAKKKDGEWIIVELGDGQVAGLPDNADTPAYYAGLMG